MGKLELIRIGSLANDEFAVFFAEVEVGCDMQASRHGLNRLGHNVLWILLLVGGRGDRKISA